MGSTNSKDCENLNNPSIKMTEDFFIKLQKEFNKEKNIITKFENDELIRVEIEKDGKKHYFFNFSSFFDPDHGFLKCLSDLYKRYDEIKKIEDVMPFSELLCRPLDKIMDTLKIKPGDFLFNSLTFIYGCVLGLAIGAISCGLMFSGNIVLSGIGAAIYIGTIGRQIYEIRKGSEEINKYKILDGEDEELIRNLFKFFGSQVSDYLEKCNVLEIVVEESYSLIPGIFYATTDYNKNNPKIFINFWKINNFPKAKFFQDLSERQKNIYSKVFESMKNYVDIRSFCKQNKKIFKEYRETYKRAKKFAEENINLKENKIKTNLLIKELRSVDSNSERYKEILEEIEKLSQ